MNRYIGIIKTKRVHFILLAVVLFVFGYIVGYVSYRSNIFTFESNIQTKLAFCSKIPHSSMHYYRCIQNTFTSIVRPQNLSRVMRILESTIGDMSSKNPGQHTIWCHDIGHIMGEIVSTSGAPLGDLVSACGSGRTCGYGCIHGVVAGMARRESVLLGNADQVCVSVKDNTIQCFHGFGHMYAELAGYDISESLAYCQKIGSIQGQRDCAGGAFMEIFQPPLGNHVVPFASPAVALQVCQEVPSDLRRDCRFRVGESAFQSNGDEKAITNCVISTDNELTEDCIAGFVEGSIDPVNDIFGATALRACGYLLRGYQDDCFSDVGSLLTARYGKDTALSVCNTVSGVEEQRACTAGTGEKKYYYE